MKVEDLHKTRLASTEENAVIMDFVGARVFLATIQFGAFYGEFETEAEALRAAALFRSAHIMQEAIRAMLDTESDEEDSDRLNRLYEALALSENTAETVTI